MFIQKVMKFQSQKVVKFSVHIILFFHGRSNIETIDNKARISRISVMEWWNGVLDWNTGMDKLVP